MKKTALAKEFENDLEKERQNKRDVEKALKEFKASSEGQSMLLKTGQLSLDELRGKVSELQ